MHPHPQYINNRRTIPTGQTDHLRRRPHRDDRHVDRAAIQRRKRHHRLRFGETRHEQRVLGESQQGNTDGSDVPLHGAHRENGV